MRCSAPDANASQPLLMGSVKTNIGHLEAAAGIAGVIKVILSLENELLPQHLHFQNPSPHIPWDRLAVQVVDGGHCRGSATVGRALRESARSGSPGPTLTSSSRKRPRKRHSPLRHRVRSSSPARPTVQRSSALGADARRVGAGRRSIPQLVERAPGGHLGGRVLHRRGGASTLGAPGRVGGQFERIRRRATRRARGRPPGTRFGSRRIP